MTAPRVLPPTSNEAWAARVQFETVSSQQESQITCVRLLCRPRIGPRYAQMQVCAMDAYMGSINAAYWLQLFASFAAVGI